MAANQANEPRIHVEMLQPLRAISNGTPFLICVRPRSIERLNANYALFQQCRVLVGPAEENKIYATFHGGRWHRVYVKTNENRNKRVIDYIDRNGIIDFHPRVVLYDHVPNALQIIPPAMTKLFIRGVHGCNFRANAFQNIFQPLINRLVTGILYRIPSDRNGFFPIYAGDLLFNDNGIFRSFRSIIVRAGLTAVTRINDEDNRRVAHLTIEQLALLNGQAQ